MNNACFFFFLSSINYNVHLKGKKGDKDNRYYASFLFQPEYDDRKRKNKIFFERSPDLYAIIDHVSKRTRILMAMTTFV